MAENMKLSWLCPKVTKVTYQHFLSCFSNSYKKLKNKNNKLSFHRELCVRLFNGWVQWLPGVIMLNYMNQLMAVALYLNRYENGISIFVWFYVRNEVYLSNYETLPIKTYMFCRSFPEGSLMESSGMLDKNKHQPKRFFHILKANKLFLQMTFN